ncbi:hypothetical protein M9H77_26094 [Catharanthus roseus]|uniref:Uncharacterized protein n=1 Tax=Catharanthus roseus TaxID=4058 RepID=A0ACC0ACR9_CATRO|nr:hypothetical protein M9H77_26094 [Catharanthus roseus]
MTRGQKSVKESSSGASPSDLLTLRDTSPSTASPRTWGPYPHKLNCSLADPQGYVPTVRDTTRKVRECFMKLVSNRYRDLMFALRGTCLCEYWKSDKFVAIFEAVAKNQTRWRGSE